MHIYIFKRVLMTIPVIICVAFIIFSIMYLTPGDPGRLILGMTAPQEAVDQLNREFGFDRPFVERFIDFIANMFKGDFGRSYRTRAPVVPEIVQRFPFTLRLAILTSVGGSLLGVSMGILSAVKQYSVLDTFATGIAMIFSAIPGFAFGMVLIYLFALRWPILPSSGLRSWQGYILPSIGASLGVSATLLRLTRSAMLETVRQDYIRTARAKGASSRAVIWNHALRNALLPIITTFGMIFGSMLGGAVVTEIVFSIPGLGTHMISAIRTKDIPVVMASTIFLSFMFCIVLLIVDILYAVVDPRVRAKYTK